MPVLLDRRGVSLVVTIDRPERRNALDAETIDAIGLAFADVEADDRVRVVVLTGSGDAAFCSGADLKADRQAERVPVGPGLGVFQTRLYPKPIIAAVNGPAIGGGLEMMLACDLVVAAEHATFGVPEVKRGVVGAGCTTRLSARLPAAIVNELVLIGDSFDARRALELHLVNRVVPKGDAVKVALELAEQMAANAPLALKMTKELVARELRPHDAEEWAAIRAFSRPIFDTEDAKEGRAAFAEKRPPVWVGR
jgi:enoyl-CoA hydratase